MWEYVDYYLKFGYAVGFVIYSFINLYKGWDAFKYWSALAIATLFFEVLK